MSGRSPRRSDARLLLSGSEEDLERVARVAESAIARAPQLASGFHRTLETFVVDTAPARKRAMTDFGTATLASSRVPSPIRSRGVAATGSTLLIVTVLTSIVAAVAPLPARAEYDIDPQISTTVSAIAAVVCALAAIIGMLLPRWGTKESSDQAWKQLYAAAIILAIGMVAGSFGLGDVVPVGTPLWLTWFAWCFVAFGATILGAEIGRRRSRAITSPSSPTPAPGSDDEFFATIARHRDRAVKEMDQLLNSDPSAAQRVDREWRAGVESLRSDTAISRTAFESATSMSAFRWQLERAGQPEYSGRTG